MLLTNSIRVGGWLLLALNLIMAIGAIQVIIRMTPAIERIIARNESSIRAGVEMLSVLALSDGKAMDEPLRVKFEAALQLAKNNVAEPAQDDTLAEIDRLSSGALRGETEARQEMVSAIMRLGMINRAAIFRADHAARQLGTAGAWGGVFMSACIFLAGVIFIRGVIRRVVRPLEEIQAVVAAQRRGESMRRCSGTDLPQEVKIIFSGINEILDQRQLQPVPPEISREVRAVPDKVGG